MKVQTNHPIAIDSPDHICPWGTANDNTSDIGFIEEVESVFSGKKIKVLDVGCSGGELVIDFIRRGHTAIGIEGSDYSVNHQRANWPKYHNSALFTCDATKPYSITGDNGGPVIFDLITAWEVLEHISVKDMDMFFGNILKHMDGNSIFCASISPTEDIVNGVVLHQSVFQEDYWKNEILPKYFSKVETMPFKNKVRYGRSFHVLLKK